MAVRSFVYVNTSATQRQDVSVLSTPCNETLCGISDRGRQINSKEPVPFLYVLFFIQADPV
jgi:hypothetical protein